MLSKEHKKKTIESFQKTSTDTGSIEVQIGILTEDIKALTEHCKKFPKDFSTNRGLLCKVSRRKRFLKYLKNKMAGDQYSQYIEKLGLRK